MMPVLAVLLLGVCVLFLATLLLFAYARGVIWWRNRKPPVVFVERMPYERERR